LQTKRQQLNWSASVLRRPVSMLAMQALWHMHTDAKALGTIL